MFTLVIKTQAGIHGATPLYKYTWGGYESTFEDINHRVLNLTNGWDRALTKYLRESGEVFVLEIPENTHLKAGDIDEELVKKHAISRIFKDGQRWNQLPTVRYLDLLSELNDREDFYIEDRRGIPTPPKGKDGYSPS